MARTIYNSKFEEIPTDIAEIAIQRRLEKIGYSKAFGVQGKEKLNYMFNWGETPEKHEIWSKVNAGQYKEFYKFHPHFVDDYSIF